MSYSWTCSDCGTGVDSDNKTLFDFAVGMHKVNCPGSGEDNVAHTQG